MHSAETAMQREGPRVMLLGMRDTNTRMESRSIVDGAPIAELKVMIRLFLEFEKYKGSITIHWALETRSLGYERSGT